MDDLSHDLIRRTTDLNAAYYELYGASIEAIKAEVGSGDRYANDVAVAVVSPRGAWCECADLPAEFSGTTGPASSRFVSERDAANLLGSLQAASHAVSPENTRRLMILAVYSRRGIGDAREAFGFDYRCDPGRMASGPDIIGAYRPSVVPRFFRCRLDTDLDIGGTDVRCGVLVFLAMPGERSVLIEMPQNPYTVWDISELPGSALAH